MEDAEIDIKSKIRSAEMAAENAERLAHEAQEEAMELQEHSV